MTWRRCPRLGLVIGLSCLLLSPGQSADAQVDVPVRMRIELLSIRNRSGGPIPVQIRLEYNRPQILRGDLELSLYDALAVLSPGDLRATLRIEDVVLSGADQTIQALLPPVHTGFNQNLAIMAWFRTAERRIPLSLSRKEIGPQLPHDLLMISPRERGALLCSCSGLTSLQKPAVNLKFLNRILSLENYNPLAKADQAAAAIAGSDERDRDISSGGVPGEHIQFFPMTVSARDLSEDPLTFCAFDILVLGDDSLGKLSREQLQAILTWLRAGGSVCILPDGRLKPQHLEFLRTIFAPGTDDSRQLSLDDEGHLVAETSGSTVIHRVFGLGRASLLPAADELSAALSKSDIAELVAFLWRVRTDVSVWRGEPWRKPGIQDRFRELNAARRRAGGGSIGMAYISDLAAPGSIGGGYGNYAAESPEFLRADQQLAPQAVPLLTVARDALMPEDVEMVPVWVIGVILAAYVVTIGPVDYFVLGMFRMRRATWILFPVVTAIFTLQTVWIAHSYMSSTETGGMLEIVDVVDAGQPVRRTKVELLFYGSATAHRSEHLRQLVVPLIEQQSAQADGQLRAANSTGEGSVAADSQPLSYTGRFPQAFSVSQSVPQWAPRLTRAFEFDPQDSRVPAIDWSDTSLITSSTGRRRLGEKLEELFRKTDEVCFAIILHQDQQLPVLRSGAFGRNPQAALQQGSFGQPSEPSADDRFSLLPTLAEVTGQTRSGFFRIVSQVSPQGSAAMEDLHLLDDSSKTQWVLVVVAKQRHNYRVFRKLYHVEDRAE